MPGWQTGAPQFIVSDLADHKHSLFTESRALGATVLPAPVDPKIQGDGITGYPSEGGRPSNTIGRVS